MLRSHLHAQNKRDRLVAAGHKPRCGYFPTPNHGLAAIDEMTFNKKSRRLITSGFLRLSNSTMLPFVLIHPYHWYPAPTMPPIFPRLFVVPETLKIQRLSDVIVDKPTATALWP